MRTASSAAKNRLEGDLLEREQARFIETAQKKGEAGG